MFRPHVPYRPVTRGFGAPPPPPRGGSGCGCSAAVLNGYLLRGMREGKWNRIVFAPTGALLSPTSTMQGESIPGVCHAVILENIGEES